MKRPLLTASLVLIGTLLSPLGVSAAPQDGETPPPPPAPVPVEEPPEKPAATPEEKPKPEPLTSDAEAVALLEKAAARQGGKSLAKGVTAFRALFAQAVFHKDSLDDRVEGRFEVDRDGLVMEWMHPSFLRTSVTHNGKAKIRGRGSKFGNTLDWLHAAGTTTTLTGERHAKDVERLDGQLDLVQALLDVVLLRKMLTDGSVWKLGEKPPASMGDYLALVRIPPKRAEGRLELSLALWLDPETHDVAKVFVLPRKEGEPLVEYALTYHDEFPKTKGVEHLRFPFMIEVSERARPGAEPTPVVELWAHKVAFNAAAELTDKTFMPPKVKTKTKTKTKKE